jgi:hypothetical protein
MYILARRTKDNARALARTESDACGSRSAQVKGRRAMPTVFVGSAAAGTPYLVGDQSRGKGIVGVLTLGDDGALSNDQPPEPGFTAVGSNPTAIITYPGGLIVSDETYGDDANSSVWSATLDGEAGGCTITAGGQVDSGGRACCHLALHPSGTLLAAANYLGEAPANDPANRGTLSIFRVGEQGLGERTTHVAHSESYPGHNAARQEAAHIHSTAWAPMDADGKTALLVCDLGSDKIWQYVVDDASGVATPNPTAAAVEACTPGAGPRHICMSMSGKFGYVICEMGSVVQGHSYDSATGTLSTQPICTIPTTPPDEEVRDQRNASVSF